MRGARTSPQLVVVDKLQRMLSLGPECDNRSVLSMKSMTLEEPKADSFLVW